MKLIILDRDGVINYDSEEYIKSPDEWQAIPGSLEAIGKLNNAGFTIALATNQSGIGRGLYDCVKLDAIHNKLRAALAAYNGYIDRIFYCPHTPQDQCECRKPKPGLLLQIANHYRLSLTTHIPFIGDSYRDIQAAFVAGCQPVLVKTGNGELTLREHPYLKAGIPIYNDLLSFVDDLIA